MESDQKLLLARIELSAIEAKVLHKTSFDFDRKVTYFVENIY